jgi:hypothetical protein
MILFRDLQNFKGDETHACFAARNLTQSRNDVYSDSGILAGNRNRRWKIGLYRWTDRFPSINPETLVGQDDFLAQAE